MLDRKLLPFDHYVQVARRIHAPVDVKAGQDHALSSTMKMDLTSKGLGEVDAEVSYLFVQQTFRRSLGKTLRPPRYELPVEQSSVISSRTEGWGFFVDDFGLDYGLVEEVNSLCSTSELLQKGNDDVFHHSVRGPDESDGRVRLYQICLRDFRPCFAYYDNGLELTVETAPHTTGQGHQAVEGSVTRVGAKIFDSHHPHPRKLLREFEFDLPHGFSTTASISRTFTNHDIPPQVDKDWTEINIDWNIWGGNYAVFTRLKLGWECWNYSRIKHEESGHDSKGKGVAEAHTTEEGAMDIDQEADNGTGHKDKRKKRARD